ncbi:MAG: PE family protein [Mycobacterium sp.]
MTYLLTRPQAIAVAAADVAGLGAAINDANATAAGAITGVLPAASDEVSAACATLFKLLRRGVPGDSQAGERFSR